MSDKSGTLPNMRLNVLILSLCQACLFTANAVLIASAALVGFALAPDPMYATVPVGAVFLFGMGFALPASILMKYIGRRKGFQLGLVFSISGACLSGFAVTQQSFVLFCFGIALIGVGNAFGGFYRFAAADVSTESYRSRAISYVLAGSVVAAFIGPNLVAFTKNSIIEATFAGSYYTLSVVYSISLILVSFLKVPEVKKSNVIEEKRPLREVAKQPEFLLAVVSATVGYGVMNLLMTSTPLAMNVREMSFGLTALVIQWHIFSMFAPSFFTGHLVRIFGDLSVIGAGVVLLFLSILVSFVLGDSFLAFCLALVLLGLGWNFTFLGGTTLLTKTYRDSEKAVVQGVNDLCVFSIVTCTAILSGVLHHIWGWYILNAGATVPLILVAMMVIWVKRTRVTSPAARPAT